MTVKLDDARRGAPLPKGATSPLPPRRPPLFAAPPPPLAALRNMDPLAPFRSENHAPRPQPMPLRLLFFCVCSCMLLRATKERNVEDTWVRWDM